MTYLALFFIICTVIIVGAAVFVYMIGTEVDREEDAIEAEYRVAEITETTRPGDLQ
jgi:hypothetical protein